MMKIIGVIVTWLIFLAISIIATVIVATLVANYFNLSGIYWWAVVIVIFLVLNSLINGINS